MRMIKVLFVTTTLLVYTAGIGQGVLEYHYGVSVQQMPDGATFRFLKADESNDSLVEFSTYYFPGIEPGDTVAWTYLPDKEDQLYIAAWNPAKVGKKHDVKFAVAWRETSGNPRFGTIKVPAGATLAGFGNVQAYFNEPGNTDYLTLFFYETYIPGLAQVEYTLKTSKNPGHSNPKFDYPTLYPNYNQRDKKILNPQGPTARKRIEERDEFVRDSSTSTALQAIKKKYKAQPEDENWGRPKIILSTYTDTFRWEDYSRFNRAYTTVYIFVEDKYYHSNTLKGTLVSQHPQLVPNRDVSFESFYHQNGVTGWKVICRALPMLRLNLYLEVPHNTPVLTVDYYGSDSPDITAYFSPESAYTGNSTIEEIVKAKDPYEKAKMLWGVYALDHGIECSMDEMKAAMIEIYQDMGMVLETSVPIRSTQTRTYTDKVTPRYEDIFVVLISPNETLPLSIRKAGAYKWNTVIPKAMEKAEGQHLKIFTSSLEFPEKVDAYEFQIEHDPNAELAYLLLFSERKKDK